MLHIGTCAPFFRAPDADGKPHTLDSLLQTGPLVLYFYPGDFSILCTRHACLLRNSFEEIDGVAGASIVGVSADDAATHRRFKERYRLPFLLLGDPSKTIHKAYQVTVLGGLFTQRVTFVIDRVGVIRAVFHHQFSVGKHLTDIKAALAKLYPAGGAR